MEPTIEDQLYRVIARLNEETKSRECALAITKAEEALLWFKHDQKLKFEKMTGAASNG